MPRYKYFHAIVLSFFSRDLYRDVYLQWRGMAFPYLLLLNVILITPGVFYVLWMVNTTLFTADDRLDPLIHAIIEEVIIQIPPMEWEEGVMSASVEQPHIISMTVDGETFPFAIIHEEGQIKDLYESEAFMLITKDAAHIQEQNGKIETRYWKEFGDDFFRLDQDNARFFSQEAVEWTIANRYWLYAIFGVAGWAATMSVMVLYRIFQALIFGGIGLVIASIMKVKLEYADAVRIACIAITPGIMVDLILSLILGNGISIPIFLAITIGYLVFAMHSNRQLEE